MSVIVEGRKNLIDVSSVQGIIDYDKVKEAGFDGVYIQASRYSSIRELSFLRNRDAALEAGLSVGAYHFCSHDTDPVAQAGFFHRACQGLGSKEGELPPMLDWEFCTPSKYADHPRHCCRWVNRFANECTALFYPDNHLRKRPRRPTLYTYPYYAAAHQPVLKDEFPELDQYPLTFANYASDAKGKLIPWLPKPTQGPFLPVPKPWTEWKLWQYSGDKGLKVPGVGPDCDRLAFNGDDSEWKKFLGIAQSDV